ncbi:MAG: histidine--tRNA ligase [Gammaproteobacteria bacterium]
MNSKLRAIKGMKDLVPPYSQQWQEIESTLKAILSSYAYEEIRFPIMEFTQIFERSIGDVTDIVQKEMYTFDDRNGDSITLRPEGTASCVRAVLEHNLLHQRAQKLWYMGPMFRHERPQKGRYRQFHQLGVECLGQAGPDIDAEVILLTAKFWERFGLENLRLELNSLGTAEERVAYRKQLSEYFRDSKELLDEDSINRLEKNPLRILDSKNPALKDLIANAPSLLTCLGEESNEHFQRLQALLDAAGVKYQINPRLVRGLDYYSKTVFEWITDELGAQGTVCAGGRYDGLVEILGGPATPAIGFAMGLERFIELVSANNSSTIENTSADVYVLGADERFSAVALLLADKLRRAHPSLRVQVHCGGGSMKSQFKKADRSGAKIALILGGDEIEAGEVTIKHLRTGAEQYTVAQNECIRELSSMSS